MMFDSDVHSHQHSLLTINILDQFDEFKSSISTLLDLGCGKCYDLQTWANMQHYDSEGNPVKPLNIKCHGFDKVVPTNSESQHKNIRLHQYDFNSGDDFPLGTKFDIVWCHDSLQYSYSPIQLLGKINAAMNVNSMLYLCVPSTFNVMYKKFHNYTKSGYYSTFTLTQLIYLLALNGFDCRDAYFKKEPYVDAIEVITYKNTNVLDYSTTWYQLAEQRMLSDNASEIVDKIGYLTDNGLVTKWLDGTVYDYRHHS